MSLRIGPELWVLVSLLWVNVTLPCLAQDSLRITITGVVIDSHFKEPVVNAQIEVIGIGGFLRTVETDSAGQYSLRYALSQDQEKAAVAIRCSAEEMLVAKDQAIASTKDTSMVVDFTLRWSGPCVDTFAPGYVHFAKGVWCPSDSVLQYIAGWVPTAKEITTGGTKFKVEILSATSFDEPRGLSMRRAQCIKNELLEAGLPDSVIVIEDIAMSPFYYCQYCEGCLPKFLYGTGHLLSRSVIRRATNGSELNALRRMVHIAFVHPDQPKVDRTARPTY